jgi:predicted NUDIX family NTP pyrophosphohydrolase
VGLVPMLRRLLAPPLRSSQAGGRSPAVLRYSNGFVLVFVESFAREPYWWMAAGDNRPVGGAASKQSAGILLYRLVGDEPEVLLVHPGGPFWAKKDLGAWSIPKGEYGDAENPRACALRELGEELGPEAPALEVESLVELGSVKQKGGKVVTAWAAEAEFDPAELRSNSFSMQWPPRSGAEREFPEVDRAEWFDPAEARRRINPAQAAFVERLLAHVGGGTA